METAEWSPDPLGDEYEQAPLDLGEDDEGPVRATLIRKKPAPSAPKFAFLAVHGWNDSFIQVALAQAIERMGGAFYAIDLRKYGRSLDRERQTPGYITDIRTYFEDLDAAVAALRAEIDVPLILYGHSTGGLTACLYANARPGTFAGLVLNSPWLDLQGNGVVRAVAAPISEVLRRYAPKQPIPLPEADFYSRTTTAWAPAGMRFPPGALDPHDPFWNGGWIPDFDQRVRNPFPVRGGWLRAVLDAQQRVAAGLSIDAPILMLTSARTIFSANWSEEMRAADIVLDVQQMWQRAPFLGSHVTIAKLDAAIHDVTMSRAPVRERAFTEIERFISAYACPLWFEHRESRESMS